MYPSQGESPVRCRGQPNNWWQHQEECVACVARPGAVAARPGPPFPPPPPGAAPLRRPPAPPPPLARGGPDAHARAGGRLVPPGRPARARPRPRPGPRPTAPPPGPPPTAPPPGPRSPAGVPRPPRRRRPSSLRHLVRSPAGRPHESFPVCCWHVEYLHARPATAPLLTRLDASRASAGRPARRHRNNAGSGHDVWTRLLTGLNYEEANGCVNAQVAPPVWCSRPRGTGVARRCLASMVINRESWEFSAQGRLQFSEFALAACVELQKHTHADVELAGLANGESKYSWGPCI